jgi:hypothetical protein
MTVLNTIYKIFDIALQRWLRLLLVEVIGIDQTGFLLLWFILDNIVLILETIQWAKKSRQYSIFFKLDFSNASNRVN